MKTPPSPVLCCGVSSARLFRFLLAYCFIFVFSNHPRCVYGVTRTPSPTSDAPMPYTSGISNNLLLDLFEPSTPVAIHSVASLSSSSDILLAGTITYSAGLVSLTSVSSDTALTLLEDPTKSRVSSFLLRRAANGSILWAVRSVLCSDSASFAVSVDEDLGLALLVGSTSLAFNVTSGVPAMQVVTSAGPVVVTLSLLSGTRSVISVHDDSSQSFYASVKYVSTGLAFVSGYCTRISPTMRNIPSPYPKPIFGGVCVARVRLEDIGNCSRRMVTMSDPSTPDVIVQRDAFSDVTLSPSGDVAYIAVERQIVVNGFIAPIHTIIAVDTDTLSPLSDSSSGRLHTRDLPDEFQTHVRIGTLSYVNSSLSNLRNSTSSAEPDSDPSQANTKFDLLVAYVARVNNSESLVVRRLSSTMADQQWAKDSSSGTSFILAFDVGHHENHRNGFSIISALCVSPSDETFAVLLDTPALVDSTAWNAPAVSKLTEGRTAVVAFDDDEKAFISQSWQLDRWEPRDCMAVRGGDEEWIVVGIDKGPMTSDRFGIPMAYLSTVTRPISPPSPSPSPTPSSSPPPISPAPDTNRTPEVCIGESSVINGISVVQLITSHPAMRLQTHIFRNIHATLRQIMGQDSTDQNPNEVRMLCVVFQHLERQKSHLCATEWHIVRWKGSHMYMNELCADITCTVEYDVPINFKARCGREIEVSTDLSITMHTGNHRQLALEVVRKECLLQRWVWPAWWITTL